MGNRLIRAITTVLGVGYLPIMPGTWGSIAAIGLYWAIKGNIYLYVGITLGVSIIGFMTCGRACNIFGGEDPREVVIDEFCGMLITLLFIPFSLLNVILGFFIFRAIDILKVYPTNRLEKIGSGYGVMLDDLAGGIMANLILQIIVRII